MLNESRKALFITIGLILGLIMSSLDQTIVSSAMPTIVNQLDGMTLYSWGFSIYMLVSTTAMPIYGKLADLFGRKKVYLIGLTLFLIGSVLCGVAGSMEQFIVYRAIHGLGAGALMPIAFTIIGDVYPPEKRGKFMGLFGTVFAVSSLLGPTLGGAIAEHWGWGWIFLINLPLGIAAFLFIYVSLRESRNGENRSIDWLGAASFTGAIVSILLALILIGNDQGSRSHYSWDSSIILILLGAGSMLLIFFSWIETKAKDPFIPLRLFKIRVIAYGNIAGFFMSAAMFGAIVYIPLFVQGVIGVNPTLAGFILTPLLLSVVVTTTIGGRLLAKVSYRAILVPSLLLMGVGFYFLSRMNADTSEIEAIAYMVVTGLGMGAVYPTLGTAAQSAVDIADRGTATSSSQFFRSIGGTIGVSVFGSILAIRMDIQSAGASGGFVDQRLLLDAETRGALTGAVLSDLQSRLSESLGLVFEIGMILIVFACIACLMIGNARLVQRNRKEA
ncbi:MDR family MFS transporter [Cohnella herbarum]|uniref:MFS transporter n=1 Tax=Cohnella herbarum TaxID=2728023 RepID=A0A7Z2ZKJ8_9BACL|nr:MDR family MFS transporter [Cohnella herbarum]QJD82192.1 MFS transporter [Cohnella herbarum]